MGRSKVPDNQRKKQCSFRLYEKNIDFLKQLGKTPQEGLDKLIEWGFKKIPTKGEKR